MALEKGTEEWMFMSEFFQSCKKFWDVKTDDKYWDELIDESHKLYAKYKTEFAKNLLLGFIDAQEDEFKELRNK